MQVQRLRQAASAGTAAGAAPELAGGGGGGGHADAKELAGGGLSTGAAGSRGEFARDVEIEELEKERAALEEALAGAMEECKRLREEGESGGARLEGERGGRSEMEAQVRALKTKPLYAAN
jgi:hypothetical protein